MKMRVADYLTSKLYEAGGEHVFLITGGMIMHLTDALLQHGKQKYTCCHHEQAAVMAADAYARFTGKLGVAYVTAGPGALNTLTGVVGAYVDSSPCIIVSGQAKVALAKVTGPRQFALQGFNTLPLFQQVTKYAVMLDDISRVRYEVEKCIYMAKIPRVGPVWIEAPLDIQGATFDPDDYEGFVPPEMGPPYYNPRLKEQVEEVAKAIRESRRPCILGGAGIRLSEAVEEFNEFVTRTGIPAVTSRLGMDLMGHDNPLFIGRPGTYGDRPANFTIQNCDLFLCLGSRLAIGLVSYDYNEFAKNAIKIIVDVDEAELSKPSVIPDIAVKADAKIFLRMLSEALGDYYLDNDKWVARTQLWKCKYPVDLPEYKFEKEGINSYHFINKLSEIAADTDAFLLDTGSCFHVFAQAFKVKYGQRIVITGGLSTMGYMPGSLGMAAANGNKSVYCITGDGSLQMNLQELQTIVQNKFPIKLVVLSNNGYLLIRLTQINFCEGRFIGIDKNTGLSIPDLEKIANAYGIKYIRISSTDELDTKLDELYNYQGAVLCEIITPSRQLLIPRVASVQKEDGRMVSMPYDDMFPFLPRDEYSAMKDMSDSNSTENLISEKTKVRPNIEF
jgi:acetolactate synthase-1/2/3 large subunit